MKYCKNCGMLLEDSSEICIGCGLDTLSPENVTKYPPKVEKKLEAEKKRNKTRTTTIIAIIIVFVLLLGLLAYILFNSSDFFTSLIPIPQTETVASEETAVEEPEEAVEEEAKEPADDADEYDPNRPIKDTEGSYYSRYTLIDEGGNKIFTGLYPEDFKVNTSEVDYSKYSVRFPGRVTFSVGNDDDTIHFTYMSPEQFWYKKSETSTTLKNNRDIFFYMSYLTYDGGQGYADMLINASYKNAKKITLTETKEVSAPLMEKLNEVSKAFRGEMKASGMDDYAHIAEDTTYAVMESECSANIYRYEIVNKDKSTLFLEFYVPVMANNLYYSSKSTGDRGTMTEWITLGVYCFEAGNEDLFDDFEPAFEVFMDNCNLSHDFYKICELRAADINDAISQEIQAEAPTAETLSSYSSRLTGEISSLNETMYSFTSRKEGDKAFILDDFVLNAKPEISVAFISPEKEKVFISPAQDEFPGKSYSMMSEENSEAEINADETT